jgi:hypothetical protein
MYIRKKTIKGHEYYYLVRMARQGITPRQQVVRYLGKSPGSGTRPTGFVSMEGPQVAENFAHAYGIFRARVEYRYPAGLTGEYCISAPSLLRRQRTIYLSPDATPFTQAVALGDLVQMHLEQHDPRYADSLHNRCNVEFRQEMRAVADYVCSLRFRHLSPAHQAALRAQLQADPDNDTLQVQLATIQATYREFLQNSAALVSYLIALALTEPDKAEHFAPRATKWMRDTLYADATTRQAFTESAMWIQAPTTYLNAMKAEDRARRRRTP